MDNMITQQQKIDNIITQEQKIDYIYETLKKQESRYKRRVYYKIMITLLIFGYSYYMFLLLMPKIQGMIGSLEKMQQANPTTSIKLDGVKSMLEGITGVKSNY